LEEIQATIEVESRQQISDLEFQMNYLGITASIAPMLGFLGTIFGVIKIFYSISATEDLSIGTISAGLYQKMILSACGLLVGIVAFAGYHFLNGWIDRIVIRMDRDCHDFLDAIRDYKAKK
jgi:biopolymer transport protein ExbB